MDYTSHVVAKPFRTSITDLGSSLEIVANSEWSWSLFIFGPIWLIAWAFGLKFAISDFWVKGLARGDTFELVFMTIWTAGWTWGGLTSFVGWLANFDSSESLVVDANGIAYRSEVFKIGYSKNYKAGKIRNLRFLPRTYGRGGKPNALGFDYGRGTKRLFGTLTQPEIEDLVERIRVRFPQYSQEATK